MSTRYRHSLITEAIIDLRVTSAADRDPNGLTDLAQSLRDIYPRQEPMFSQTLHAPFPPTGEPTLSSEVPKRNGFRLFTADDLNIAQITSDGFTFIRLKPYNDWNTFSTEARRIWGMYKSACRVETISRAAVRCINRLDLSESDSVGNYLLLRPFLPNPYPTRAVEGFFMQLQMPQADIESMLVINLARIAHPEPEMRSFVLDFDLFREHVWDADHDNVLWDFFGRLRVRKNELFEASITDRTRILMEPIG